MPNNNSPADRLANSVITISACFAIFVVAFGIESQPANAEMLFDMSLTVAGNNTYAESFQILKKGQVSITFSSQLVASIQDASGCKAYTDGGQLPPPRVTSNSGSLVALLWPGDYCVVLQNNGPNPVQTELRLDGQTSN